MRSLAIVIPTVPGREEHLERCLQAYWRTAPDACVYVEHDHSSCGEGWIAGAAKAEPFDYLHLTADDLEPHEGWLAPAIEAVDKGYIPAPVITHPGGALESAGLAGFSMYAGPYVDWQPIEATTVPFLTAEMWDAIGMLPIHYCSDLWVSHVGRRHGWETAIRDQMRFTHYTAPAGRNYGRVGDDNRAYLEAIQELA